MRSADVHAAPVRKRWAASLAVLVDFRAGLVYRVRVGRLPRVFRSSGPSRSRGYPGACAESSANHTGRVGAVRRVCDHSLPSGSTSANRPLSGPCTIMVP